MRPISTRMATEPAVSQNGLESTRTHSRLNCSVKFICRCYCSELISLWTICTFSTRLIAAQYSAHILKYFCHVFLIFAVPRRWKHYLAFYIQQHLEHKDQADMGALPPSWLQRPHQLCSLLQGGVSSCFDAASFLKLSVAEHSRRQKLQSTLSLCFKGDSPLVFEISCQLFLLNKNRSAKGKQIILFILIWHLFYQPLWVFQ